MPELTIAPLPPSPAVVAELSRLLAEAVEGGAILSFLHPVAPAAAEAFWTDLLASAAAGRAVVLGAWDGAELAGTVTLLLDLGENKRHRADITKLITAAAHRGRGVASALMIAAEAAAVAEGRTLITLGTAVEGGAAPFYEKRGYSLAGIIPDYLGRPHGGLTGQMFYWKRVG